MRERVLFPRKTFLANNLLYHLVSHQRGNELHCLALLLQCTSCKMKETHMSAIAAIEIMGLENGDPVSFNKGFAG